MRRPPAIPTLLAALTACRPAPPPAPRDAAPARRDVARASRSACDEVLDEGRRALDAWRRRQRAPVDDGVWGDLATFNRCVEADERLWATVLGPPAGDPRAATLAGRFKLVFVGRDGTRSEAWPAVADAGDAFALRPQETSWRQGEDARTRLGALRLFDYDGDGAPELLAEVTERPAGGDPATRVVVWRATAARLDPYEPAMGLHPVGVEDFDGDGRPDLRTHAELVGVDDARPNDALRGPALYARSLPGGLFALSSGAALARNRALCPAPPTPPLLVRADAGPVDARASAARVACAMLWRAAPSSLEAELRRECPARPDAGTALCAGALSALASMTRASSQADLRAAVSFEAGAADGGAARAWRAVLEGVEGAAPVELGAIAGECDLVDGQGRAGEVASLRCWAGEEGVEVRAVRLGAALVFQRRAAGAGVYAELRRVAVAPGLALRAGALLE